jgi:hypothetical protein
VIELALGWHQQERCGRMLALRVTNGGDSPLPNITAEVPYQNETPQPWQVGRVPSEVMSGSDRMEKEFLFDGTLQPGTSTTFVLSDSLTKGIANLSVALSPERYRLAVLSDQTELAFVGGSMLGAFLDGYDDVPARSASDGSGPEP